MHFRSKERSFGFLNRILNVIMITNHPSASAGHVIAHVSGARQWRHPEERQQAQKSLMRVYLIVKRFIPIFLRQLQVSGDTLWKLTIMTLMKSIINTSDLIWSCFWKDRHGVLKLRNHPHPPLHQLEKYWQCVLLESVISEFSLSQPISSLIPKESRPFLSVPNLKNTHLQSLK